MPKCTRNLQNLFSQVVRMDFASAKCKFTSNLHPVLLLAADVSQLALNLLRQVTIAQLEQ